MAAKENDPDHDLVRRAQEGDTQSFDELVIKYSRQLYSLIYNMTSDKEDTHDLMQEVFSKAYRSLRHFRGKSTFYTWIYSKNYQYFIPLNIKFLNKFFEVFV